MKRKYIIHYKCPVCGKKISKKFIWLSFFDTSYLCTDCNSIFAWTWVRRLLNFIGGFIASIAIVSLRVYMHGYNLKILLLAVLATIVLMGLLIYFVPNQLEVKLENHIEND